MAVGDRLPDLSGCNLSQWRNNGFKVGPNYCPPPAEVADNWIDSDDPRVIDQPPDYSQWWTVFQDPVLNELVETAHQQNLTLREAGFRVLQAQAQRAIANGNRFPQAQQIDGGYTREQIGVLQQPYLEPIPGLFSRAFDAWSLSGNLSLGARCLGSFSSRRRGG